MSSDVRNEDDQFQYWWTSTVFNSSCTAGEKSLALHAWRAAIEYDRTRPPEAARSSDLTGAASHVMPGLVSCTLQHGNDWPCSICGTGDASPSPDPRGRSGDADLLSDIYGWMIRECAAEPDSGEVVDSGVRPLFNRLCAAMAAPATTGVHVAHCCVKHGCKYGNPNCPVASGELAGDGSCESCADEPATTGARAVSDSVEPAFDYGPHLTEIAAILGARGFHAAARLLRQLRDDPCKSQSTAQEATGARAEPIGYLTRRALDAIQQERKHGTIGCENLWACAGGEREIPVYLAPPEVTHGAAIGGDVVKS